MTRRIVMGVLIAALMPGGPALAQGPGERPAAGRYAQEPGERPAAGRYVDPVDGLSLEQAVARALEQEPSLRAARSEIDVAQGMRVQASLRPNPTVSVERLDEPAGMDSQTAVAVEWPLELFRRSRRIAVAEREVTAVQLEVADRERLLASEVRMRFGEVLATVRDLGVLDELVGTTRRQHAVLSARVEEGATPPLDRDLLDVELRRLESDRLLQAGRTEVASFELRRVLGIAAGMALTVRDTLEDVVRREAGLVTVPGTPALLEGRADVRAAAARVEVAEAAIDRVQAEGRFDMSLFASYMRMDAGFPQQGFAPGGGLERVGGSFHYVSAGAMINLPVFNRNQGDIAAARAARAGAAAAHEAARLAADTELAAALARDEHAREAVSAYSSGARTLARQNLAVIGQSYDLGRVTVFDVLAEQRRYLDVERAYTEALRAAFEARTALERAIGGGR